MSPRPIPVFVGPSLTPADRVLKRFEWRPPASAGDLLALLDDPPDVVCLIDGYFDRCAAPWHKEILLLMEAGTRVFGASSMGALRAAELAQFGMIGVGAIYAAYRKGRLTGDDEVALIHATERLDWTPLTVPMIEVRATLARACRERRIDVPTAKAIRALAHDLHYEDRDWPALEQACVTAGLIDANRFRRLAASHVQLKRLDALLCLEYAVRDLPGNPSPVSVPRTWFIRSLAQQLGMALEPSTAPDRAH